MCDEGDNVGIENADHILRDDGSPDLNRKSTYSHSSMSDYLNQLIDEKLGFDQFVPQIGFIRYSEISDGDKVMLAVDNLHDEELVSTLVSALRQKGAKSVDVLTLDFGEDRELTHVDEIAGIIRTEPWWIKPRWYDYWESVINYAKDNGYDLLIHGRGGPFPSLNSKGEPIQIRMAAIPWHTKEEFLMSSTIFPFKLHLLINEVTWNMIYKQGRGGKVRVTDFEGTDIEFTMHEKYFDTTYNSEFTTTRKGPTAFGPYPTLGHLFSHPTAPFIPEEDARGIIAGTTSHLNRPFPRIQLELEGGKVQDVKGGAAYGDAWRNLLEQTDSIKYPDYPRKGLFWINELAIGTNPKIRRPSNVLMRSSGGNEFERNRSGVIHAGLGTSWRGPSERWASEKGVPYGHLHVHLLFPTYEIRTTNGNTVKVIENGHLTALDDPEVRSLAKKYGDPDELLKEDWIPKIPGISTKGRYEEYAGDPAAWIGKHG